MMQASNKIFFPGLNGLRFLAALAAIIAHIEIFKRLFGIDTNSDSIPAFDLLGWLALNLFFVLSGFLITYLLMVEREHAGTIDVKNFYIRRALRIWPLYYLLVIVGFFVLPSIAFLEVPALSDHISKEYGFKLASYVFLIPHLAASVHSPMPHIGQLWSIGVEEQFYLFWPLLMKFSRSFIKTILAALAITVFCKAAVFLFGSLFASSELYAYIKAFSAMSRFEGMIIGAVGAYLVFTKHSILAYLYNPLLLAMSVVLIPVLLLLTPNNTIQSIEMRDVEGILINIASSVIFVIVVLNVSTNKNSFLKLENTILDFLGKISYGIYLYHVAVIILVTKTVMTLNMAAVGRVTIASNLFTYLTALPVTILVAHFSYRFFEKKFIKMKLRFSEIISGDLAKESVRAVLLAESRTQTEGRR